MRRRAVVFVLLAAACPLALAQAYKWKDAQGVTHYSDSPPPGNSAKVERIKMSGSAVAPAGTTAAPAPARASTAPAPSTGPVADTPANRAKLCDQLRKNMDVLTKEAIVSVDDGKGGSRQLDANARKSQVEQTQAQMTLYCKQS